ncbi:MAG: hydantoinase B/oxoprolinase family protein [Solirubrobacteraceae bacterium]|nr:hydantoinase B/oxoprolinase family protein [Solirubrobacteraceae bacterium]
MIDPVMLRITAGSLAAACEEMGEVLIRAAHSANIKERRDCSTGVFDPIGQMTMQAEHIPVHLGAMPASVAAVVEFEHAPGDAWILNDPFSGGTHLPDITIVTPIFSADGIHLGFASCRAHHADVGGREPGSMPADSRTLEEEGVVIPATPFARGGELDRELFESLINQMRHPQQRAADLRAQLAACRRGETRVREFAARHGVSVYREATAAVLDYAERLARNGIAELPAGEFVAEEVLEADAFGAPHDIFLKLRATVSADKIVLDFSGSDPQHSGNLNCPLAVTESACFFAIRALVAPDAPACAGAWRPVTVIAPSGSILNANAPAAVAGGNVETSSRVADLVMRAFGRAQGQGTMNNLTLGNHDFTHYETFGGGQAGQPDAPGPSAVHVAMSNTLNTPVEALEIEFPLRVREYSIRRGSGGAGANPGGDGLIRDVEVLADMRYSLIAERRRHAPHGAAGGDDGKPGTDTIDGTPIPGKSVGELKAGSRLRIATPGGGGFGSR